MPTDDPISPTLPTSKSLDDLDFSDITPIELPVRINGKSYTLREATGDAACKYRNEMLKCTTLGPDGKPSTIRNMADVEPLLISLCLFDDKNRMVHHSIIRSWPNRVQNKLYETAKRISELDESTEEDLLKQRDEIDKQLAKLRGEEESPKNELDDTEDGSDWQAT